MSQSVETPQEAKVASIIVEAHNEFMRLVGQEGSIHPDEQRDWCDGIHQLQRIIATRIAARSCPKLFGPKKLPSKSSPTSIITYPQENNG